MSRFSKEKLLFYLPTLRLRVRVLFRFRYVFENVWSPAKVTKIVRKSLLLGTILGSNWCRHSSKDLKLNHQKSVNPIYAHFYDLLLRMYMNDCAAGCAKSGSTCYRKRDVLFDMTLLWPGFGSISSPDQLNDRWSVIGRPEAIVLPSNIDASTKRCGDWRHFPDCDASACSVPFLCFGSTSVFHFSSWNAAAECVAYARFTYCAITTIVSTVATAIRTLETEIALAPPP